MCQYQYVHPKSHKPWGGLKQYLRGERLTTSRLSYGMFLLEYSALSTGKYTALHP